MVYRLGQFHADIVYEQKGPEPSSDDERVAVFMGPHAVLHAEGLVSFLNGARMFEVPQPPPGLTRVTDRYGMGWTLDPGLPAAVPGGWWPDEIIDPEYENRKGWMGWLNLLRERGPLAAGDGTRLGRQERSGDLRGA